MDFREATDSLCAKLDHADLANALGVSVQTVRQARLASQSEARRAPPREWEHAIIRLAEKQVWHYRRLIERVRDQMKNGSS
jgi:hypothetical protein